MLRKVVMIIVIVLLSLSALSDEGFIPSDFEVPELLETEQFRIRMLTVNDVVKDYDAVMSSLEHLQDMFLDNWGWPTSDLTLEQDLIDLGWHQKEFQNRTSFAYTVVAPDESRVVGCIYIFPFENDGYDAEITMWVRADTLRSGLDQIHFQTVKLWVNDDWPFEKVAYPGRDMSWKQYNELRAP